MMNSKYLSALLVLLLAGCASDGKPTKEERYADSPIPESDKTMSEMYAELGSGSSLSQQPTYDATESLVPVRKPTWEELSVNPYTLNNTVKTNFETLPNPTMYIYFPPSLSKGDRIPKPGWMSEFKMYEKDEYALPGEVNTVRY